MLFLNYIKCIFNYKNVYQRRATSSGIDALSMRDYVGRYVNEYPELMDLVAADDSSSNRAVQINLEAAQYTPHLPLDQILSGVKSRQLFRGTIHPSSDSDWTVCYVILHSAESGGQRSVKIIGRPVVIESPLMLLLNLVAEL